MTTPKRPAHRELERHDQRVAEAVAALREAEAAERQAATDLEAARDVVRECFDLGADAAMATEALEEAKRIAEQRGLAVQGVEARVRRAEAARADYHSEVARDLLAELRPDFATATADLRKAASALLDADRRWRELSAVVASHLRALKLEPARNSPGSHGLEPIVRDVKRSMSSELVSPAPHFIQATVAEHEQVTAKNLRRERETANA
jgi:hypothetical protein